MVNCNGDMVVGYSGSSATQYIGAYYSWFFGWCRRDGCLAATLRLPASGGGALEDP